MATPTRTDTEQPMELCDVTSSPYITARPFPSWAVLNVDASTHPSELDDFLSRFRPSQCTRHQVTWISIIRSDHGVDDGMEDPDTMVREWQWLSRHGDASASQLDRLARVYNVLSGKWMVFCPSAQVDAVWQRIAHAIAAGRLGSSAKVSPFDGNGDHVICVYADNYLDREEVQRLRQGLRQLGHHEMLLFKPDVYTHCGIYKGNEWGIPTYTFKE